jgi:dTDP-4-dehydrorhamnose reductase
VDILILGGGGFVGHYLYNALNKDFRVERTYATHPLPGAFHLDLREQALTAVIDRPYDIVINNINPLHFSYRETAASAEAIAEYCRQHGAWLINISSVSAHDRNRHNDSYSLKKHIVDEIVVQELDGSHTILRFPQIFDLKGLSRKSQPGLFFMVDAIRQGRPLSLFKNATEPRNYLFIDILTTAVRFAIDQRIRGIHTVYVPHHTLSLYRLATLMGEHRGGYNSELITIGTTNGATYFLPEVSDAFRSWAADFPGIETYLSALINYHEQV